MEKAQLRWFPGWLPEPELAIALRANPVVEWFLRMRCPELAPWVDRVLAGNPPQPGEDIRRAELTVLESLDDLLVYALDPAIYASQPFMGWDSNELTGLVDFTGEVVIDVGAGTGRPTWLAAEKAAAVYAVEPVSNLREYLWAKSAALAGEKGRNNVFPQDGLITRLPFPDAFADVVIGGYVFGDLPEAECAELERVTRPGGMIVRCPGGSDRDEAPHTCLVAHGFQWSRFTEPCDGIKRKYWKIKS